MTKTVFVRLDDAEYEESKPFKGRRTWKQVLKDGLKATNF